MNRLIPIAAVLLAAIPATCMVILMAIGVCAGTTWRIVKDLWQHGVRQNP